MRSRTSSSFAAWCRPSAPNVESSGARFLLSDARRRRERAPVDEPQYNGMKNRRHMIRRRFLIIRDAMYILSCRRLPRSMARAAARSSNGSNAIFTRSENALQSKPAELWLGYSYYAYCLFIIRHHHPLANHRHVIFFMNDTSRR